MVMVTPSILLKMFFDFTNSLKQYPQKIFSWQTWIINYVFKMLGCS